MSASTYTERKVLNAIFAAAAFSTPATLYFGLSSTPVSNTPTATGSGGTVTYGANSMTDTSKNFTNGALVGMWIYAGAVSGQIANNTATAITLTGNWSAQPANGTAYSITSYAEPVGNSYGRVAVTANNVNFPAATGNTPATITNGTAITWPSATGAGWGDLVGWVVLDAASGGNLIDFGALNSTQVVQPGNTMSFVIGNLVISFN